MGVLQHSRKARTPLRCKEKKVCREERQPKSVGVTATNTRRAAAMAKRQADWNQRSEQLSRRKPGSKQTTRSRTEAASNKTEDPVAVAMRADFSAEPQWWTPNPNDPLNRFDFVGTTDGNELVKHRPQLRTIALDNNAHTPGRKRRKPTAPKTKRTAEWIFNFSQFFVRPLHNFLQYHFGLDNEDEIQLMVMPRRKTDDANAWMDVFFATNSDTVTQETLDQAVADWKVMGVYRVRSLTVVTGDGGRHAEQKLLDHFLVMEREYDFTEERAVLIGERLPCVACRIFAIPFEDRVTILPSHGHLYISTVAKTPGFAPVTPKAVAQQLHCRVLSL